MQLNLEITASNDIIYHLYVISWDNGWLKEIIKLGDDVLLMVE